MHPAFSSWRVWVPIGSIALALVGTLLFWHPMDNAEILDIGRRPVPHAVEGPGLCPWRDPAGDQKRFFPSADGIQEETLVVTRQRDAIAARLGHPLAPSENALRIYRILRGLTPLGEVVTQSVRGESGVIELALAVNSEGKVVGVRLQRLRERPPVAGALRSSRFLGGFEGKSAASLWRLGQDIPDVPAAARPTAQALLNEARSLLIVMAVAADTADRAARLPGSAERKEAVNR